MFWGFVKCSLGVLLALLKPIVKIPKIIPIPALLKIVKVVAKVPIILHCVVDFWKFIVICRIAIWLVYAVFVVFAVGAHGRSAYGGGWRPFFGQSNVGRKKTRLTYPRVSSLEAAALSAQRQA